MSDRNLQEHRSKVGDYGNILLGSYRIIKHDREEGKKYNKKEKLMLFLSMQK